MIEPGLSEYQAGDWFDKAPVMLPEPEIRKILPTYDASYMPFVDFGSLYPESWTNMEQRFMDTTLHLRDTTPGNLLLVTHAYGVDYVGFALVPSLRPPQARPPSGFFAGMLRSKSSQTPKPIASADTVGAGAYCCVSRFAVEGKTAVTELLFDATGY